MSEYFYLLENEQYQLYCDEEAIAPPLNEVALCFNKETGTLHKHGPEDAVKQWQKKTCEDLVKSGATDLALELITVCGRFEVEDLNRCISTTGYCRVLWTKICEK